MFFIYIDTHKNMIFKESKTSRGFYKSKKGGFAFTISHSYDSNGFYVVASNITKDIRFNSLWSGLTFETFELAVDFCKTFNYEDHSCLGKDVKTKRV